jgi:hypothetical protein
MFDPPSFEQLSIVPPDNRYGTILKVISIDRTKTTIYMIQSPFHKMNRAIHNPDLAKEIIIQKARNYSYKPINKKMELVQRNKKSRVGLVLNWGLHQKDNWTVAQYPFFVKKFIERFDPLIITSQKVYDRHCEHLDSVFAFGARNNKGPTLCYHGDQTVLLFASDPNNKSKWLHSYINENNIDYALTPYYQPFLYYIPDFDDTKLIHFPWAVPKEFIVDPNSINYHEDDYIAITGASGNEIYEIRDWCRTQSNIKSFETSGHKNRRFSHSEYYKWLRNFDAMIAAGSFEKQWQYTFAKYYEIPAARTLLFAQYTADLDRAGFSEKNCLIFNSKREFNEKKEHYLDNPNEYFQIRQRGVQLIQNRHTINHRLNKIANLFE